MKISHEVPSFLLEESLKFNNYQYALPHLLEQDERYRKFFIDARDAGREIYLDNSLHEIGVSMDDDILLKWIRTLNPSHFFIPDVWEDADASINNAIRWSKINLLRDTTKIAVVQAKNLDEAIDCYLIYKDAGYEKIAFSYGANYYLNYSSHPNKNIAKALGRVQVISELFKRGIISPEDKIHLLGCQVPQEFGWYKDMPFIESIDTSNPIMAALEGIRYTDFGIDVKPTKNMNNSFYTPYHEIDKDLVKYNIEKFKQIIK